MELTELIGVDGQDGYTPVKGVDYWTETEQNEIISTATTNVENNFASTIATIQSNSSNALNTANTANNTANTAKSIAEGANQALSYTNYQAMITAFNELADNVYKVGQNIMIITLNVPDLWISAIENTSITYNYTNDEAITTALSTNGYIQVGYYKLSALETQKVDLTDYYTKTGTENKIEDYLYQIMPTDSASGTIAAINDSTTMFNAIDVTGTIEPVQDLHGYDNPWPAGGGKNIINANVVTVITSVDNQYNIISDFITLPAGTYTLSWTLSASVTATRNRPLYIVGNNYVYANSDYKTAGRGYWTFTISEETELKFKWWGHTVSAECTVNDFQLESGSTATSYAPYSNICPITGWTGASVVRTGKNLIPNLKTQDTSARVRLGESSAGNGAFYKAGTYKISWGLATAQTVGIYWRTFKNGENGPVVNSDTIVITEDVNVKIWLYASGGISVDNVLWWQVELGSTATPYEPYQSETYDISWQSEAGTVYGGNLDVTTGVLTVDRATKTLTNSDYFSIQISTNTTNRITASFYETVGKTNGVLISDSLKTTYNSPGGYSTSAWEIWGSTAAPRCWISVPAEIDTVDKFKSHLSSNPIQVVYELATPVTYQLTPQEVSFLLGTNNLWVDTGDINVTYKADIQKYIDKKTN